MTDGRPEEIDNAAKEVREFAKVGLRDDSSQRRRRLLERAKILCDLPAVKAAGGSSTAQFEYLVQAIIDAIDDIDVAPGHIGELTPSGFVLGNRLEADALRILFGLTNSSRRATWRKRQEDAARVLSLGWEYFRHDIQKALLCAVAERLLLSVEGDNYDDRKGLETKGLICCPTQADVERDFVTYIEEHKPRQALLLELSTATISPILLALRDAGTQIRLLVANPQKATAIWQQERMWSTLAHRLQQEFRGYHNLDLRVYSVPPGLRGRLIGELIAVGWYSHRDDRRLEAFDPAAAEVWGHDNSVIAGHTDDHNGQNLAVWFRREFKRLWSHRLTMGGPDLMRTLNLSEW